MITMMFGLCCCHHGGEQREHAEPWLPDDFHVSSSGE